MMARALLIFAVGMMLLPLVAAAHTPNILQPYWGNPLLSCGTSAPPHDEPCNDFCDLLHTAQHIIHFVLTIVLIVLGPIMAAVGGVMILISAGSTTLRDTGKKTLTAAVAGIGITLASFLLIDTFLWFAGNPAPGTIGPDGKPLARVAWPQISCIPPDLPPDSDGNGVPDPRTDSTCNNSCASGFTCVPDPFIVPPPYPAQYMCCKDSLFGQTCNDYTEPVGNGPCGDQFGTCTLGECVADPTSPGKFLCTNLCGPNFGYCPPGAGNCLLDNTSGQFNCVP